MPGKQYEPSKKPQTANRKGELHRCMKCQKQLTIPGKFYCPKGCAPKGGEAMRDVAQGGSRAAWKSSGPKNE